MTPEEYAHYTRLKEDFEVDRLDKDNHRALKFFRQKLENKYRKSITLIIRDYEQRNSSIL